MSTPPSGRDKRQYDRVRIPGMKHIWNLSEGGAYIATETPKRLGSTIYLDFRLGGEGPKFSAMAKVIRVLHRPNPKSGEPQGMAVQFIKVDQDELAKLKDYLARCAEGSSDSMEFKRQ